MTRTKTHVENGISPKPKNYGLARSEGVRGQPEDLHRGGHTTETEARALSGGKLSLRRGLRKKHNSKKRSRSRRLALRLEKCARLVRKSPTRGSWAAGGEERLPKTSQRVVKRRKEIGER